MDNRVNMGSLLADTLATINSSTFKPDLILTRLFRIGFIGTTTDSK